MKDDLFDEEDSNKYVPEDLNLDLEDDKMKQKKKTKIFLLITKMKNIMILKIKVII